MMGIILKKTAGTLLLLACLFACLPSAAQSKPCWVQKGEKSLNRKCADRGYQFKVFHTYDVDMNKLRAEQFNPLFAYVCEQYGVTSDAVELDSLYMGTDSVMTYCLAFPEGGGESVVYARKVDEYCVYEDYADNTFQFEFYQLYAVAESNPDVFDCFELTRRYNARATVMSLIPGWGQIHKGQKVKGYVFLGSEVALVTSAIAFNMKKHYSQNKMSEEPQFRDSWRSKSNSWRNMRNICIGLAGGLYIYNLIDAAVAKGSRRVIVKKPKDRQFAVAPMGTPDGAGLSFVLNF